MLFPCNKAGISLVKSLAGSSNLAFIFSLVEYVPKKGYPMVPNRPLFLSFRLHKGERNAYLSNLGSTTHPVVTNRIVTCWIRESPKKHLHLPLLLGGAEIQAISKAKGLPAHSPPIQSLQKFIILNKQKTWTKTPKESKRNGVVLGTTQLKPELANLNHVQAKNGNMFRKHLLLLHDWSPNSSSKLSGSCISLVQLLAWHEVSWLEAKFHAPVVAIGSAVMGKEEMHTEKKPMVHYSKLKQGSPESCTLEEDSGSMYTFFLDW